MPFGDFERVIGAMTILLGRVKSFSVKGWKSLLASLVDIVDSFCALLWICTVLLIYRQPWI